MQVWLPPGFGLGAGAGAGGAGGPGGAGGVGAGAGPPPVQGQDGLPHFGQGRPPGHTSGGEAAGLQSTTGGGATGAAEAAERSTRSAALARTAIMPTLSHVQQLRMPSLLAGRGRRADKF